MSADDTVITEPKPPFRFGHRNARRAPPNSALKTSSDVISDPRKKSRRETDFTDEAGAGGSPLAAAS